MNEASSERPRTASSRRLDPDEVPEVIALSRAAGVADGADPLSESVLLRLSPGGPEPAVHLLARGPRGTLTGYAHLTPEPDGTVAELVVHPAHRRRGVGRALLTAALDATRERPVAYGTGADPATDRGLRVWAHGDHPSAAALALDLGFDRVRVLWQLRRPLAGPLAEPRLPAGVSIRPFRPGHDEDAWLAVNRRAFAEHPEQGRWTAEDLRVRMAEPWFDPAGFLLAVQDADDRLLGFHWTKVHGGPAAAGPDGIAPAGAADVAGSGYRGEPVGEVYVLGVDPTTHGTGLGKALTLAGLRHLRDRGLNRAMLYVDDDNAAAMALYHRLGFGRWTAHVTYRRTA
ncbi:mycothiol synthase [Micromonospora zhanjiangensis]|uniref:Mycothiol acetyltransferase n=1 Tax=Micromonospora zhanjiangensis TaxID=1522057 RepID=A0ABV8KER6_9ACTN